MIDIETKEEMLKDFEQVKSKFAHDMQWANGDVTGDTYAALHDIFNRIGKIIGFSIIDSKLIRVSGVNIPFDAPIPATYDEKRTSTRLFVDETFTIWEHFDTYSYVHYSDRTRVTTRSKIITPDLRERIVAANTEILGRYERLLHIVCDYDLDDVWNITGIDEFLTKPINDEHAVLLKVQHILATDTVRRFGLLLQNFFIQTKYSNNGAFHKICSGKCVRDESNGPLFELYELIKDVIIIDHDSAHIVAGPIMFGTFGLSATKMQHADYLKYLTYDELLAFVNRVYEISKTHHW
ncbi:hypothetical protein HNP86_001819 [Methanococcus maripaludis]|uniref:Uncharacterized protein n=1 Tax=Methanococcus maripaludis TaxID=39152 RepID=A0A7J9NVG2_METMI|nr:hypothetical protein [Methanococcus maripaludis]MBA2851660.1 hypothetical protein [Methanococcus maripaludis]